MIGQTWPSEIKEFKDEKTGRTIRKLTSTGNNFHMYFTENSFDAHKNEIIFPLRPRIRPRPGARIRTRSTMSFAWTSTAASSPS